MASPTPYVMFPGTARQALTCYGDAFGCDVQLHTDRYGPRWVVGFERDEAG